MRTKVLIGLMGIALLLACIAPCHVKAVVKSGDTYTFRLGCMTPADYPFNKASRWFKQEIEKESKGRIKLEIFDGGVLGNEAEMWAGALTGNVDIFVSSPGNISTYVPAYQYMDGPYFIKGFKHFANIVKSGALDGIDKLCEEKGIVVLGQMGGGRRVMLSKQRFDTLDSIKGIKMRVWPAKIVVRTWEALGTTTTLVSYAERYQALQTGLIVALEGEISNFLTEKLYEPTKYLILTDHCFGVRPLLIGKKQLSMLPKDLMDMMIRVGKRAGEVGVEIQWKDDEEATKTLNQKFGIEVVELKDKEKWVKATEVVREEFRKQFNLDKLFRDIKAAE